MLNILLLIIIVYIVGFFVAMPIGATQIEIVKRSMNGYIRQALLIVVGSASSDLMYGFIAMFGMAPFLKDKKVMAIFWFAGSVILIVLGILTLRKQKGKDIKERDLLTTNDRISLFVGFSLAVINPTMMLWWLIGAEFLRSTGIISHFTTTTTIIYLLSGTAGIASYLSILALAFKRIGKLLSKRFEQKLNIFLGVFLILIAIYFFIRSAIVFI